MPRFLIDVNLPYRFGLWHGPDYIHMVDIDDRMPDSRIWSYAKDHAMVIVTRDADFSARAMLSAPPPYVVHVRLGNVSMRALHERLTAAWPWILENAQKHALVTIWPDRIETVTLPLK